MAKIVHRINAGRATDLRFVSDDHVLAPDEKAIKGYVLPSIESLHSLTVLKIEKVKKAKAIGRQVGEDTVPVFRQINAALGIYQLPKKSEITKKIRAVKQAVDEVEDKILKVTTKTDLNDIVFDFDSLNFRAKELEATE